MPEAPCGTPVSRTFHTPWAQPGPCFGVWSRDQPQLIPREVVRKAGCPPGLPSPAEGLMGSQGEPRFCALGAAAHAEPPGRGGAALGLVLLGRAAGPSPQHSTLGTTRGHLPTRLLHGPCSCPHKLGQPPPQDLGPGLLEPLRKRGPELPASCWGRPGVAGGVLPRMPVGLGGAQGCEAGRG